MLKLDIAPSLIVDSGGGYHAYWLFNEPAGADAIERVETANRRLVNLLDGDGQSVDASRMLRLPGTVNSRYEHKPIVTIVHDNSDTRYDLDVILAQLPAAPEREKPQRQPRKTTRMQSPPNERQAVSTVQQIAQVIEPAWLEGQRHELCLAMSGYLADCGWDEDQVQELVEAIAEAADDDETVSRLRDVQDTSAKLQSGMPVTGRTKLSEMLPPNLFSELEQIVRESLDLRVLDYRELVSKEPPPVDWLVDRLIPRKGITMFAGDAGIGKSWIMYHLAELVPAVVESCR